MKFQSIISLVIIVQQLLLVEAQDSCYYLKDKTCVSECPAGTYADANKNCINCPDTGCSVCNPSNPQICIACSGLYFLKLGKCVLQCESNEFKKVETNECEKCNLSICSKCSQINTWCTECSDKSNYLIRETGQCLSSCNDKNGYNLTGSVCTKCTEGCLECNTLRQCSKCENNYYLSSGGVCVIKCQTDYFCTDDLNKQCIDLFKSQKCQGKNNSCKTLDSKECLKCPYFYDLKTDGTCSKGDLFEDQLSTKLLGYVNGKQCSQGCLRCTSQRRCQSCIQGYFLNNNQCNPCPLIQTNFVCLECFQNPDQWSMNMMSCSSFINIQSQEQLNMSYSLQYSINLTNNQAELMTCSISSLTNCIKCDTASNKCIKCNNGYFLDPQSGTCNKCSDVIPDCTSCRYENNFTKSNLICNKCSNGKIQNKDKQSCIFCEYGCDSCEYYDTQQKKIFNYNIQLYQNPINGSYLLGWNYVVLRCVQCKPGYNWNGEFPFTQPKASTSNHQCIQSITNCIQYTWGSQGQMICLKCNSSYAIFKNISTNEITCKNISPDYSSSIISQCQAYFINSSNQLSCMLCNPSYMLSDDGLSCVFTDSCSSILDKCSKCTSNKCLECEQGYILDFEGRGGCVPCQFSSCSSCLLSVDVTPSSLKSIGHPAILSDLNSLYIFNPSQLDQLNENIVKKEICTSCMSGYSLNSNSSQCERSTNQQNQINYNLFNQMKYGYTDKCNWYVENNCISCKPGFTFNVKAQQCLINDTSQNIIGVQYERRIKLTWKYCKAGTVDDAANIFDKMIMKNQQEEYLYGEYGIQNIYVDVTIDCSSLIASPSVIITTSVFKKWNVHINILPNTSTPLKLKELRLLRFKTISIQLATIQAETIELGAIDNVYLSKITLLQPTSSIIPLNILISSLNQITLSDITLNNLTTSFGDQLIHFRLFRQCTVNNFIIKGGSFEVTDIFKIGSEDMNDENTIFNTDTQVDLINALMVADTDQTLLDNPDLYSQPLFYQSLFTTVDIQTATFISSNILSSYINHISIQVENLIFKANTLTDSILILCESLQASPNIFLSPSQLESINWFSKLTLINAVISGNSYTVNKNLNSNAILQADQINIFMGEISKNKFENYNVISISTGLMIQTFSIKENTHFMAFIKNHIAQTTNTSVGIINSSSSSQNSSQVSISKSISEITLNELNLTDNLPITSEYSFILFNSVLTFSIRGLSLTESTEKFFNQGPYIYADSVNIMNIKTITITSYLPQQILSLNNVQSSCIVDSIISNNAIFQVPNTASLIFIQSQQGQFTQSGSTPSVSFSNSITFSNIQIKLKTEADGTFTDNRTNKKIIHIISFWKSKITLTNIQFNNCGTVVIQADKSTTDILSSNFKGNIQTIINSNKLSMNGCTISDTHATQFLSSEISMFKCDFNSNENIQVSITTEDSASIVFDTTNFTSNKSTQSGGALSIQSSSKRSVKNLQVTILNSTFNTNTAATQGGAIFSNIGGHWNIKKSSFSSNKSLQNGGQALHLRSIDDSNAVKDAELFMQQVIIKAEQEVSDTTKGKRILQSVTTYISYQTQNSSIATATSASSSSSFFWMVDIKDFNTIKQTYCSYYNYRELSGSMLIDSVENFQDFSSDYVNFMNKVPSVRMINSNSIEFDYTNFKDSTLQESENVYEFAGNQKILFKGVIANNIKCINNCKSLFTFYKNFNVSLRKGFYTNIYSNGNVFYFLGKEYSPSYPSTLNYLQVDIQQAEFKSNQVFSTIKIQNIRGSQSTNLVNSNNKIVSISKCLFTKNQGMYGTGILSINSAVQIFESEFSSNVAKQGGAGVFSMLGRFGVDSATVFKDNNAIFYTDYYNNEIYQIRVEYLNKQFAPDSIVLQDQAPGQQLSYIKFQLVDPALNPITMNFIRDYYNINIEISCSDTCELDNEQMQIIEDSYFFMFKDLKINGAIDKVSKLLINCNLVRKYDDESNKFLSKEFEFQIKFRGCSPGEYLSKVNSTYSSCVKCQENSYSLNYNSKQCFTCPYLEEVDLFTSCQGDSIQLPQQYWRSSNATDKLVFCKNKNSNCLSNDICKTGQAGAKCETCSYQKNYGRIDEYTCATYSNFTFSEQGVSILKIFAIVFYILLFNLSILHYQFTHIPKKVIQVCEQFPGVKFKHILNHSSLIPCLKILWFCLHIILLSFDFNLNISYISKEVLQFFFLSIYQLQIYSEWILSFLFILPLIPSYVMTIKLVSLLILLFLISLATLYLTRHFIISKFSMRDSLILNFFFHGFGIIIFTVNMIGCETISSARFVIADLQMECNSVHHIIQQFGIAVPFLIFIVYQSMKHLAISKQEAIKSVRSVDYIMNMEYPESFESLKRFAEDLKNKNLTGKRSPKVADLKCELNLRKSFDIENPLSKQQNQDIQSDKSTNQCEQLNHQNPDEQNLKNNAVFSTRKDPLPYESECKLNIKSSSNRKGGNDECVVENLDDDRQDRIIEDKEEELTDDKKKEDEDGKQSSTEEKKSDDQGNWRQLKPVFTTAFLKGGDSTTSAQQQTPLFIKDDTLCDIFTRKVKIQSYEAVRFIFKSVLFLLNSVMRDYNNARVLLSFALIIVYVVITQQRISIFKTMFIKNREKGFLMITLFLFFIALVKVDYVNQVALIALHQTVLYLYIGFHLVYFIILQEYNLKPFEKNMSIMVKNLLIKKFRSKQDIIKQLLTAIREEKRNKTLNVIMDAHLNSIDMSPDQVEQKNKLNTLMSQNPLKVDEISVHTTKLLDMGTKNIQDGIPNSKKLNSIMKFKEEEERKQGTSQKKSTLKKGKSITFNHIVSISNFPQIGEYDDNDDNFQVESLNYIPQPQSISSSQKPTEAELEIIPMETDSSLVISHNRPPSKSITELHLQDGNKIQQNQLDYIKSNNKSKTNQNTDIFDCPEVGEFDATPQHVDVFYTEPARNKSDSRTCLTSPSKMKFNSFKQNNIDSIQGDGQELGQDNLSNYTTSVQGQQSSQKEGSQNNSAQKNNNSNQESNSLKDILITDDGRSNQDQTPSLQNHSYVQLFSNSNFPSHLKQHSKARLLKKGNSLNIDENDQVDINLQKIHSQNELNEKPAISCNNLIGSITSTQNNINAKYDQNKKQLKK